MQPSPTFDIVGEHGLLHPLHDGKLLQLAQNGQRLFDVHQGAVEVVLHAEVRRRHLLDRRRLLDNIVESPRFALQSTVPAPGRFQHLGRRILRRHTRHPPAHGHPLAHLLTHQLPRGDPQMFAHQIVAGHVQVEPPLPHHVVEGIGADIEIEQFLVHGRAGVLAQPDEAVVGVESVHRHLFGDAEVVELRADALFVWHHEGQHFDLLDLHIRPPRLERCPPALHPTNRARHRRSSRL